MIMDGNKNGEVKIEDEETTCDQVASKVCGLDYAFNFVVFNEWNHIIHQPAHECGL